LLDQNWLGGRRRAAAPWRGGQDIGGDAGEILRALVLYFGGL
jgi:hypothetical protein